MSKYGKWIGGGLGWAFGGPIGALLGFVFGSMFDTMSSGKYEVNITRPADFKVSLLILAAAVMKADKKLLKSELNYVKAFFIQNFGTTELEEKMLFFRDILKQDIEINEICAQIKQYMDYSARLQLLHFLFGLAYADGEIDKLETEIIKNISNNLGISINDFESLKAIFVKSDPISAYKILEISPEASIDEIKKAYRAMAKKYHPDKVTHLGDEFQKAATEKFKAVNNAYEEIKKQRNFV
ncbi:MAG: TerB family tellurite resistance protein [Bacteroidales bacterium]|nr:TerB family tellurite resistance protein [Bacteroidales bacterium]